MPFLMPFRAFPSGFVLKSILQPDSQGGFFKVVLQHKPHENSVFAPLFDQDAVELSANPKEKEEPRKRK